MDKSCHSSGDSTTTTTSSTTSNRDDYLNHLNKISHKISKPIRKQPPFNHHHQPPPPPPPPPQSLHPHQQQQQQQHQPPVYNINKSDFRDVVQRLTGSPAHDRFAAPPPIHQPKQQSTRLQRIRPPPLAHVTNRPPPVLNNAGGGPPPLSPLPPFPAVHVAADSPISAYMRFLQNSIASLDSDPRRFPAEYTQTVPVVSPRWFNPAPPPPQQQQNQVMIAPPPSSPMAFGCFPSPRSPYPLLSPGLLFSPTGGQLGFPPLSPRFPISSPRWKDH